MGAQVKPEMERGGAAGPFPRGGGWQELGKGQGRGKAYFLGEQSSILPGQTMQARGALHSGALGCP